VQIGVLATKSDGSGSIEMQMDAEEFIADLALVINASNQTEDGNFDAAAAKFRNRHNITFSASAPATAKLAAKSRRRNRK
jgi:hypothetical protein